MPENTFDTTITALGLPPITTAGTKGTYYIRKNGATYVRTQSGGLFGVGRKSDEAKMIDDLRTKLPDVIVYDDGFYSAGGIKFSRQYYERLWEEGRPAPYLNLTSTRCFR